MNGIKNVTDRIIADANAEAESIVKNARAEAADMVRLSQASAQKEYDRLLAEAAEDARLYEERLVSNARMELSKSVLAEKQGLVTEALNQALKLLEHLPEKEYAALCALLASRASDTGREQVIFSDADRRHFGKSVVSEANRILSESGRTAELSLSSETRPISGGLILKNEDIEVNCSFETLVYSNREEYSALVARTLFE